MMSATYFADGTFKFISAVNLNSKNRDIYSTCAKREKIFLGIFQAGQYSRHACVTTV